MELPAKEFSRSATDCDVFLSLSTMDGGRRRARWDGAGKRKNRDGVGLGAAMVLFVSGSTVMQS